SCTLHVYGSAAFDSGSGAAYASASASVSIQHGTLLASATGFEAPLIDPFPTTLATSWSVIDTLGGTTTLARDLVLRGVTPGLLHTARGAPAATLGDSPGDGQQPWLMALEAPPSGSCGSCLGRIGSLALASHTCALAENGQLRCWGSNDDGQVGDGSVLDQHFPAFVCASGSYNGNDCVPLAGIAMVAAGDSHTCALRGSGQVVCWGNNNSGRLGDGTTDSHLNPVTVCATGDLPHGTCVPLTNVAAIAAGAAHSCALRSDGNVACWGFGWVGQLGSGSSFLYTSSHPDSVCSTGSTLAGTCVPMPNATALAAGNQHTCAIVENGSVKCWGVDVQAQLGAGVSSSLQHNPVTVCVTGSTAGNCDPLTGAFALAAGAQHTCALLQDGHVRCWGIRDQLGTGAAFAAAFSAHPVPVCRTGSSADATCSELDQVAAIAAGNAHTCALRESGEVLCWGSNLRGALGNGQQSEVRYNPVVVCRSGSTDGGDCAPLSGTAAIAAGDQHSCALRDDGSMQCWGKGDEGQLGDPRAGGIFSALHPGGVCLTTVDNLCVPLEDAALRQCVALVVEVAP
ncbi:MAG: hypothetical protein JXR83_22275, partial [Deltaproteobacteria bacterium]|nr:hypothetical protein [Deltaproteobacteria bacterium]